MKHLNSFASNATIFALILASITSSFECNSSDNSFKKNLALFGRYKTSGLSNVSIPLDSIDPSCFDESDRIALKLGKAINKTISKTLYHSHYFINDKTTVRYMLGSLAEPNDIHIWNNGRVTWCTPKLKDTLYTLSKVEFDSLASNIKDERYSIEGRALTLSQIYSAFMKGMITSTDILKLWGVIINNDYTEEEEKNIIEGLKIPDECIKDKHGVFIDLYKTDLNECKKNKCTSMLVEFYRNIAFLTISHSSGENVNIEVKSVVSGMSTIDCKLGFDCITSFTFKRK